MNVISYFFVCRFALSSEEAGFILSTYNIASCIVIPVISYFGGKGNKPNWIGSGMALMGVGCLIFASPHFFAESYQVANVSTANQTTCFVNEAQEDFVAQNVNWAK